MNVYKKFKIHFYREIFSTFQSRETSLTSTEIFALEMIEALGKPTVNEFASFAKISSPNAAYKVGKLIKKGYLVKTQSETDKREFHLKVTEKYYNYLNISYGYIDKVVDRMKEKFSDEDAQKFEEILRTISTELMPEMAEVKDIPNNV